MRLHPTADRLRAAVASGSYGEVDRLLDVYRREVEQEWHAAAAEERQAIAREVTGVLQWARHTILAARSHTQSKLIQFRRQHAYAPAGASVRGFDLDA